MADTRAFVDVLPRFLGWFSMGVGLSELVAPRRLSGAIGVERRAGLLRAYGLREIAAGVGLLAAKRPAPWLWMRLAGDAFDLALIAEGLRERRRRKAAASAFTAVAAIAALDAYCALRATNDYVASRRKALADYSERSGLSKPPAKLADAALRR